MFALLTLVLGQFVFAENRGSSGVARLLSWEDDTRPEIQTAEALVMVEDLPEQELTLVLTALPERHQLVLSRIWRVKEGVSVLQITDDTNGWWARMTERSTLRFDSTEDLGKPALAAQKWKAREHRVTIEVAAPGIEKPLTWSSPLDNSGLYSEVFEQLDAEGLASDLVRAMPETSRQGLRVLSSLLTSDHHEARLKIFEHLVEVLVAAIDRHGDREPDFLWRGAEWERTGLSAQPLWQTLADEYRAFASKFRQVSEADPLALIRPSKGAE